MVKESVSNLDHAEHFSVQKSVEFYEENNIFPWDSIEELLRYLSTQHFRFTKPGQLVEFCLAHCTLIQEISSRPVHQDRKKRKVTVKDLSKMSDERLLAEAIAVANVLFETINSQNDEYYVRNPEAWMNWLHNVALYIGKFSTYEYFIHEAQLLIDRKDEYYLGMKYSKYEQPNIQSLNKVLVKNALRNSVKRSLKANARPKS